MSADETPDYFTDNGHIFIAGITGSKTDMGGKTSLANWWLDTWGRSHADLRVFFNAKGTSGVRGTKVHSVSDLADAYAAGERHFNYIPPDEDWASHHQDLKEFTAALPTEISKVYAHDETPDYGGEGSLEWFVKIGGQDDGLHAANVKNLVLAQDPVDVPKAVRKQTDTYAWVGPTTDDYIDFFRKIRMSNHHEWIQQNHEPYQWSILQGPRSADRTTYEPVPEVYA